MEKHENLPQQENNVTPELQDERTPSVVTADRVRRAVGLSFFVLMLATGGGVVYRTLYHTDSSSPSVKEQEEDIPVNKDEMTASAVQKERDPENDRAREDDPS